MYSMKRIFPLILLLVLALVRLLRFSFYSCLSTKACWCHVKKIHLAVVTFNSTYKVQACQKKKNISFIIFHLKQNYNTEWNENDYIHLSLFLSAFTNSLIHPSIFTEFSRQWNQESVNTKPTPFTDRVFCDLCQKASRRALVKCYLFRWTTKTMRHYCNVVMPRILYTFTIPISAWKQRLNLSPFP